MTQSTRPHRQRRSESPENGPKGPASDQRPPWDPSTGASSGPSGPQPLLSACLLGHYCRLTPQTGMGTGQTSLFKERNQAKERKGHNVLPWVEGKVPASVPPTRALCSVLLKAFPHHVSSVMTRPVVTLTRHRCHLPHGHVDSVFR